MKKIVYFIVPLFIYSVSSIAQPGDSAKIASDVSAFNKALVNADKKVLENLTADELSYGHSSGKIENKAQFITNAISGSADFLSIDITEQTIQVTGNISIVRHLFSAKLTRDGKPDEIKIGVMMIWQKQKKDWKLIARQAYKL